MTQISRYLGSRRTGRIAQITVEQGSLQLAGTLLIVYATRMQDFRPPLSLRSSHAQAVLGSSTLRRRRVLLADDDPVMPVTGLARLALPAASRVDRTRFGGHCAFLNDDRLESLADRYLLGGLTG